VYGALFHEARAVLMQAHIFQEHTDCHMAHATLTLSFSEQTQWQWLEVGQRNVGMRTSKHKQIENFKASFH
jgi:hypothetical protein